jgi:hypothetical protein
MGEISGVTATPAAYAANLSATRDRLRNPEPAPPIACCSTRATRRKTDPLPENWKFRVRVFRGIFPWLGGAEDDEGITVLGRPKGVHSSAGR